MTRNREKLKLNQRRYDAQSDVTLFDEMVEHYDKQYPLQMIKLPAHGQPQKRELASHMYISLAYIVCSIIHSGIQSIATT